MSLNIENQKQTWMKEQFAIAKQVEIVQEETDLNAIDSMQYRPLDCPSRKDDADHQEYYGGVDVSFPKVETDPGIAVYVIVDGRTNKVIYQAHERFDLNVPYISGFLAFREIDPLIRLVQAATLVPSVILVDGNGSWHERGAGIASVLGVRTGIPTIGVGKTFYCMGPYTNESITNIVNSSMKAATTYLKKDNPHFTLRADACLLWSPLVKESPLNATPDVDRPAFMSEISEYDNLRGLAIPIQTKHSAQQLVILVGHGGREHKRSGRALNPIFISVGHKLSIQQATDICAQLAQAKIPEPVRQADLIGREILRNDQ